MALPDLRKFAQGKDCQVRIPGYCNHNPETTILAHCRKGGVAGASQKPPDLCGAHACSGCHDVLDGRRKTEYTDLELDYFWLHGMNRTLALVSRELKI